MTAKYPRIGRCDAEHRWSKQPPHEGPRCAICGGKAVFKAHVEVSWFRGDDSVVKVCIDHKKADPAALLAAVAKKARSINGSPLRSEARPSDPDLNPVSVKDLSASASPATKEQQ